MRAWRPASLNGGVDSGINIFKFKTEDKLCIPYRIAIIMLHTHAESDKSGKKWPPTAMYDSKSILNHLLDAP